MEEREKIIIYTDESGLTKIDVTLEEDTLWLTQAQMAQLYQTSKSNVSEHIKHIFAFYLFLCITIFKFYFIFVSLPPHSLYNDSFRKN